MKLVILSWLSGLLGFGLLVGGVAMMHVPAACVVAGVGLIAWSRLADRAAAALKPKPKGG
ncbi:hypothetical protein FIV41_13550 [Pseudomonas marginalis]|uniref:Uncharacterized protein n=1 Tax=Pseudomonas marginalis TaxID=298 RepID=A0A9X9FXX7_PSEMA|nr:hypothetical protein [Pseudomonas marginalis]TWR59773.1 hypothetical protein FIV41_13550 [Pseudomonas marginalis]SED26737.1 hypothetical protein SAMN04490193_5123 [Pseudomonas marginalis]